MPFRDRGATFERARSLELELAQHLVRAPELPVDIPQFGLRLLGVLVDERGVGLAVGREQRIGTLYYRRPAPTPNAPSSADGVALPALPAVEAWPESSGLASVADGTVLQKMRGRLRDAAPRVDWELVWRLADELRLSPVKVPLDFFRQIVGGVAPLQGLVRTGFRCNQDCGFCWQGRDWPSFDAEQILTWIEDLRAEGAERLIISGGEPTLDRALFQYLERATALGLHVTLETNAIRMAQAGFVERLELAAPGFDTFVSFHSPDAAVSDRATRAPGTHRKTVLGIAALLDAGVRVKLNAVISSDTIETLGALPDFIAAHFQSKASFRGLMISLPQTPFDESLDRPLRAAPEAIRVALAQVIERADTLGIQLDGLPGPCGPPLCAFGADPRVTDLAPIPHRVDFRDYLPACEACRVRSACFGVHRSDREVFGDRCAVAV